MPWQNYTLFIEKKKEKSYLMFFASILVAIEFKCCDDIATN